MPATAPRDAAADAAEILHEDRVSPVVQHALDQLAQKRWVLFHARDYLLGVLQLLESRHLLRDHESEERTEKGARAAREELRAQRKGYSRLAHIAAGILPETFGAEVARIANVRTEAELESGGLTTLTVAGWAHGGSGPDAIALAKVRKLASSTWRRKTIKRAELLEALGISDERTAPPTPEGA